MTIDVGEAKLHRFDLDVHALGRVGWVRREVNVLEDAERDQRGEALAVGRDLVHAIAAIPL